MNLLTCFYALMTALFAALIMVPFLRRWALERGELDQPDVRKQHDAPMPRLGGVAIFFAFLLSVLSYAPIEGPVRGMLVGGIIVFFTGLADDLYSLSSRHKFTGQIGACLTTIVIGKLYIVNIGNVFGSGPVELSPWIGIPFTVFAVVGVINAINLIDGLDGLAGGVSVIALSAFGLLGLLEGDFVFVMLAFALLGAVMGFLKYNFYPAQIFMGDTGSLVVGFLLGFMAVYMIHPTTMGVNVMTPVIILGLPIFDTLWVMTSRFNKRLSPFIADRTHVHHKFLDLGFEHRFTVVAIYGISLFWACSAVSLRMFPEYLLMLFFAATAVASYLVLRHILRNRKKFAFLSRDDQTGLRDSVTYQQIADSVDRIVLAIRFLLAAFMLLAAWSVLQHNELSWKVALVVLCGGIYLWFKPVSENRQFLMLVVYVAAGMAAMEVWHADQPFLGWFSVKRCGDILLGTAGALALLKIQFRKGNEFFLSSADFLALAVCIFMAVASQQAVFEMRLDGPLFRTVIALIAIRTIASRGMQVKHYVVGAAMGFLALVTAVGLLQL